MSRPEIPLKIMGWHMDISWTDGKTETITDFPDDISQAIDDYLTELEVNRYERCNGFMLGSLSGRLK